MAKVSDLLARVEITADFLENAAAPDDTATPQALGVLRLVRHICEVYPQIIEVLPNDEFVNLEHLLAEAPRVVWEGDGVALLEWARTVNEAGRRVIAQAQAEAARARTINDPPLLGYYDELIRRFEIQNELAASFQDALRLQERVQSSVRAGELALEAVRETAGEAGSESLASYFGDYSRKELKSANTFRIWTIVLIGIAASYAIAVALVPSLRATSIVVAVYHVAAVGGPSALSAYLGRQASLHRRTGNWARALQVQLLAFGAFIEPVDAGEARDSIYEAFSRRVLGPPPETPRRDSKSGLDPALLDLLTAMIQKQ